MTRRLRTMGIRDKPSALTYIALGDAHLRRVLKLCDLLQFSEIVRLRRAGCQGRLVQILQAAPKCWMKPSFAAILDERDHPLGYGGQSQSCHLSQGLSGPSTRLTCFSRQDRRISRVGACIIATNVARPEVRPPSLALVACSPIRTHIVKPK